jgi:hypothetical protein
MNWIYNIYFFLPNFKKYGFFGKVFNKALEMMLKRIFDRTVPPYLKRTQKNQKSGLNTQVREEKYIVSLTSFPARIDQIWISIECILRQTFKPDALYLWLSEDQFPDKVIPKSLTDLKKRGLIIKFCKDDLKAHKKYYYTMLLHPKDNIITVDDDLYYDENLLKNVIEIHKQNPSLIATNRAHKITFTSKNKIQSYKNWEHITIDAIPSHLILQTGGCGTLYPPSALIETTFDKKLIKELCFYADDVWLKVMSILSDKKVVTNRKYNKDHLSISTTQREKLVKTNVVSGGNDLQLSNLLDYFKIDLANYNEK